MIDNSRERISDEKGRTAGCYYINKGGPCLEGGGSQAETEKGGYVHGIREKPVWLQKRRTSNMAEKIISGGYEI